MTKVLKSEVLTLKGILDPKPKISMFCDLSQNSQHLDWKIIGASNSKFSKELKNSFTIYIG